MAATTLVDVVQDELYNLQDAVAIIEVTASALEANSEIDQADIARAIRIVRGHVARAWTAMHTAVQAEASHA